MEDKLLTVKEVAERLSLTEYTITQRFIKNGKIRAVRISDRTYRVKESELERFIEERSTVQAV